MKKEQTEKTKEHCKEISTPAIGDNMFMLVLSDSWEGYFYSMLGKMGGKEIKFSAYPHIGLTVDTILIENKNEDLKEPIIDIRYYVSDNSIEFYAIETNDLPLYVHNIGNKKLEVRNGGSVIVLDAGKTELLKK